jgi:hypothetical protein
MAAQGGGRIINISGLAALQTGSTIGSIRNICQRIPHAGGSGAASRDSIMRPAAAISQHLQVP